MSTDHLNYEWWTDDEGLLWVRHFCGDRVEVWHPPHPQWRITGQGDVTPSFDCARCGSHSILRVADHVEARRSEFHTRTRS